MKPFCKDGGLHKWEPVEGSTTPGVHHCEACGTVATLDAINDEEPRPSVTILEIDLPLPHKYMHPNGRPPNWQALHRVKKEYRNACGQIAYAARNDRPGWLAARVTLRYLFTYKEKGKRADPDNLVAWAKTAIDSLTDAGILTDDRALTYEPAEQYYEQAGDALIILLEVQT